ncbi:hypothetical protein SLE2022_294680 [Rubroshorea leprosula]
MADFLGKMERNGSESVTLQQDSRRIQKAKGKSKGMIGILEGRRIFGPRRIGPKAFPFFLMGHYKNCTTQLFEEANVRLSCSCGGHSVSLCYLNFSN